MNAMITLLEKQFQLHPKPEPYYRPMTEPQPREAMPTDTCPRCHGDMVFTLESGKKFCLNCGEL